MIAEEIDGLELICEDLPDVEADSGEMVNTAKDDIKNRYSERQNSFHSGSA